MKSWEMVLLTPENLGNDEAWMHTHRRAVRLGILKEPAAHLWLHTLCSTRSGYKLEMPHTERIAMAPLLKSRTY